MKIIINENQRGLLFRNGCYKKLLQPGRYLLTPAQSVETVSLNDPLFSGRADRATLLADPAVARETVTVEVPERQLSLHYVDGIFRSVLTKGKYVFWKVHNEHTFVPVDISAPEVSPDFPTELFREIPQSLYTRIKVEPHNRAALFIDGRFIRLLDPRAYYFWENGTPVMVRETDARLVQQVINGQELLTRDKVTLRISLALTWRVTDFVRALTEVDNHVAQLHTAAQLALRDYVGQRTLDEILDGKEQISACVLEKLRAKQDELFVEIREAGVRDIILPGEIRDIMNAVLTAEKQAQANVITRREEVASTRSLLNTAKLMEENPTLYKLKELEYIERICGNVGSINLTGGGDLLSQLAAVLKGA